MSRSLLLLLVLCWLFPVAAYSQQEKSSAKESRLVPWTSGISFGVSILPITKERLRLGYHWEPRAKRQWVHEISLINVGKITDRGDELSPELHGTLKGWQFMNELRFYHNKYSSGPTFWYHSVSLAYMHSWHELEKGINCKEGERCAYFRHYEKAVAHTASFGGNIGMVITTINVVHFNFYAGMGLRGTYFPEVRSSGYFGKNRLITESESFVLEPYFKVGMNAIFRLRRRS